MGQQENPENKIGVYLLHNQETDQGYVGSSKDIHERGKEHFQMLKAGKHPNRRLQAAYAANPNFDFVGLVLGDREVAFDYEQEVIDELRGSPLLLNIAKDARYCQFEGFLHTDESKAKIGAASKGNQYARGVKHTAETKAKVSAALTGRPVSEQTRRKIGIANTGKYHTVEAKEKNRQAHLGKTHGEETRQKMSIAHSGKQISEEQKTKLREAKSSEFKSISADGVVYPSINEAARQLGLNAGTVYYRVNSPNFPAWFFVTA